MHVRQAQFSDLDRCVEMALAFINQTAYQRVLAPSHQSLSSLALTLLEQGVIFLLETQTEPGNSPEVVGMLGVFLVTHPISGILIASEICWWVEPAHRGGSGSMRLIAHAEEWARSQGAKAFHMIAPTGSSAGEVYRRRGYVEVETSFHREL